ncbi:glutathione S-transferase family protein [Bosea sp. BK604]|uniref:glutathione S-transferase family protein n=1 Tax=Bosea sp. BK604 TaxID=2512180 RepID=UPI00104482C5|nr:glutathione S-transferase family protein [Bosea sp. BK604]TCR70380.1 glutathione S-transferase [Bosea sp. BK604]
MDLIYQSHSPYARKVLVFAHEAGLAGQLRVIHHETSPTRRNDAVFALNPLGKVPVLVLSDGFALIESSVICDYLGGLGSRRLIPESGHPRWSALRLQALAQGLCDAGIALRWETERRPEPLRYPPLAEGQKAKLIEGYDFIEREAEFEGPLDIGQIALATALAWLEFRGLPGFADGRPRLARWYREFCERPSMKATAYAGQTHD